MKKSVFNQSLKSAALGVGSIVQYEKALTSGEENARFVIVENYGDGRVKVRELTSITAFGFSTYTRFLSDFVAVTDPAEIETLCDVIKKNETPLYLVVLENLENERKAAATLDEAEEITAPTAAEIREAFESREYICGGWNGDRARHALETFEGESAKAKEQKERAKTARRAEILKRFAKESEEKAAEALHTFAEIVTNHFTPTTAKFKAFADGLRIWLESAPATLNEAEEITETNAPATETRCPENVHNYYYIGEYGREIYVTISDNEIYNDGEFSHACDVYGNILHSNITGEIIAAPADAPTYPNYKTPARVLGMAKDFIEGGGLVQNVTRRGVNLVAIHRPKGSQTLLLSPADFEGLFRRPAPLDDPDEITAFIVTADGVTYNYVYESRAEAQEKADELTYNDHRNIYNVLPCAFNRADFAEARARQLKREKENAPLYNTAGNEEKAKAEKPARVAGVVTAALFLLSLTIGKSQAPAQIYTHDPAGVLAQVAKAGETVTAYTLEEINAK